MRVLLVSPAVPPDVAGNATTAVRLASGLRVLGVDVVLARAGDLSGPADLARAAAGADLLHIHHLVKTGRLLLPVPEGGWLPVVASVGGTDLLPDRVEVRDAVMAVARRILVPTEAAARIVTASLPELRPFCRLVPRGVSLGQTPFDLRSAAGAAPGDLLFFLPAGFREVKRNALAVPALAALRDRGVPVRFAAAGPVLDPAAAAAFDAVAAGRAWIRRLPPIPPDAMGAALAGADVVLNTSSHEGMSNALLEGMLAGRAVLASDIPGNRAVVDPGRTGLLFADAAGFAEGASALAGDPALRARLGVAARREAETRFSPEAEAAATLAAYREALADGLPA